MKRVCMTVVMVAASFLMLPAQGLFEEAQGGGEKNLFEVNGYIRGVGWAGEKKGASAWEQKALYSEGALKLKAGFGKMGDAFMDVRVRGGLSGAFEDNGLDLREAYVNLYLGPVSLRVGQQIDVWGRADSYSPTDNITPVNALFHSPEADDMRLGNFLLRARGNLTSALSLEGVWIPVYRPSVLPVDPAMNPQVALLPTRIPAYDLNNSGYGFRMSFDKPAGGLSLSWFDGYEPYPGLLITGFQVGENNTFRVELTGTPFREQVAGLDFETALGAFGIRGEAAYRQTHGYADNYAIPFPDLRYVAGIDRTFGNFTVILQYIGHYVLHYTKPVPPGDPQAQPDEQMDYFNRMMFRQLDRVSHMVSLRPSFSMLHDDLQLEVYGEYNFTTREYLLYPRVVWKVSDMIRITAGGNLFHGASNSLYDMVRPLMNGVFLEARVTF